MKIKISEDDIGLVEGCVKKDLVAWSSLIKKYSNLISISIENRLKIHGFTPSRQDIEDIRQNVLASIWKDEKLKNVRNRENISYWLAIVSGNEAIAFMRRRAQEPPRMISLFDRIDERELSEFVSSTKISAEDESIKNEISKKVEKAVEALPVKERLTIKLNLFHNKKYHEIAKILNLPKGTVSSYIKRAKEKLRECLKDFY